MPLGAALILAVTLAIVATALAADPAGADPADDGALTRRMTVEKASGTIVAMLGDGIATVRAAGDGGRIQEKRSGQSLFAGYSRRELRTIAGAAILISLIAAVSLVALSFAGGIRRARDRMIEAVHERERAEEELLEKEEYLRAVIENSLDIITIIDADWIIRFESPSIEALLGYEPEELVGSSALALVHPDDIGRVRDTLGRLAAKPGRILSVDFRFRRKDGSWRTLESIGRNLFDHPVVAGIVVNSRDITERREMEEQLRQAQKMEAVGQLTGGVAHDFNNLLTVILGNAELISERCGDNPELHEALASVSRAARRGASLTRRLLAFSRKQALRPRVIDVDGLIEGMTDLIDRSMGETIELDIRSAGDPWPIEVDAGQLENVILNLVINARDAMQGGGRLVIETGNTMLDDDAAREANLAPGRYVRLAVGDSGAGMSKDVLERVFEPFFTTKPVSQGSGLGLSMVYGFIKQSGGHVKIDSEPDRGTIVRIFLPAAAAGAATAAGAANAAGKKQVAAAGHGHGETVLVVEDDDDVRDSVVRALAWLGYNPIEAPEAKAALALVAARGDFALMFTDVVLPGGVSGVDLARDARALRPGLKVLFTSGYMERTALARDRLKETDELIAKPYAIEELARRIQEMLRARAA